MAGRFGTGSTSPSESVGCGAGAGMATAGGELGAARGGPTIRVARASEATAFAEAGVAGRADLAGRADAAGAPGTGPAGGWAAGLAAGWLNTTVELAGGAGFFWAPEGP